MSMQYGSYRKDIVMFFSSIHADYTKMGYPAAIVRALDFLKNTDLQALPGGRHAIEGDMMYANVDDVETKLFETTKPESHKNYVDIQFMVKGQENMGFFVDRGRVKPIESYPERDCYFYPNESVDEGQIYCPEGYYTVFFPSDIHRPLLAVDDKPIKIRKVVVKVHVSLLGE